MADAGAGSIPTLFWITVYRTPTCLKLNFSYYEGKRISDFPTIKGPTSGGSDEGPTVIIMQLDIFTYKKKIIPVHTCFHWWWLLADFEEQMFKHYNSMMGGNICCLKKFC